MCPAERVVASLLRNYVQNPRHENKQNGGSAVTACLFFHSLLWILTNSRNVSSSWFSCMKMISGLDEDSFVACCRLVLQKSEELRDGWRWEQGSEGYLRKTVLHSVSIQEAENSEREIAHKECQSSEAVLLDDEDDDNVAGANCPADPPLWVHSEFHVLFSSSYRTPVMFFRSNTLEGRALSLDAMWSFIKPKLKSSSEEDLLSTVTQQEHPLLGQTFFMLHPCKTNTFMRPVLQAAQRENRAVNYVLTWLSVVGPLVGLEVPLEYCSGSRPDQT